MILTRQPRYVQVLKFGVDRNADFNSHLTPGRKGSPHLWRPRISHAYFAWLRALQGTYPMISWCTDGNYLHLFEFLQTCFLQSSPHSTPLCYPGAQFCVADRLDLRWRPRVFFGTWLRPIGLFRRHGPGNAWIYLPIPCPQRRSMRSMRGAMCYITQVPGRVKSLERAQFFQGFTDIGHS